MAPNLRLILGGPGCGKTTRLLRIVEEEMNAGVAPSQIAFVTFTKEAAREASERAAAQFGLNAATDLPWFRTIHSLAYQRLGIQRDEILDRRNWAEFSALVGEPISGHYDTDSVVASGGEGDQMLRIVDYAATTMMTLPEAWHALDESVDWYALKRFDAAFSAYKSSVGKMDFTDMLLMYARDGSPLDVRVAVIDEAQDLTRAQWEVVMRAFRNAERLYVGGDDDQAIYKWAGADVEHFMSLSTAPEVLPVSHRLPKTVHALAARIAGRISRRYVKRFAPTEKPGTVEWHQSPEHVDLTEGDWLLLARNTYMLGQLEAVARDAGVNYRKRSGDAVKPEHVEMMYLWERLRSGKVRDVSAPEARALCKACDIAVPQLKELARYTLADLGLTERANRVWHVALEGIEERAREYYITCLRRGEKLKQRPRVRIETIHGVKGAEAEHVLLMTDLSARTARGYDLAPDHEHRVFYVGATRARSSLHLIAPQSDRAYVI